MVIMVEYTISDIHYHGVPYFSRKIEQTIDFSFRCKNWFTPPGSMLVETRLERPYLDNNSFAEDALNFFLANFLSNMVDNQLQSTLPPSVNTTMNLPNSNCSCLGVDPGVRPDYTDASVLYSYKPVFRAPIESAANRNAVITLKNLKRLVARGDGGVLYQDAENIGLEFYADHTLRYASFNNIRENDVVPINLQPISIPRPSTNNIIVLIANIIQQTGSQENTRFAVFGKNENWGNGDQKIIIQKSYWTQPQRLPGGGMTKPIQNWVDAYELTVNLSIPNENMISEPTQPVTKPIKIIKPVKVKQ
jgi:hypothetical protein